MSICKDATKLKLCYLRGKKSDLKKKYLKDVESVDLEIKQTLEKLESFNV